MSGGGIVCLMSKLTWLTWRMLISPALTPDHKPSTSKVTKAAVALNMCQLPSIAKLASLIS
jgi:hypothetical protein